MTVPDGYVDPTDPGQVGAVVEAAFRADGLAGVFDLLGRLPGARRRDAVPGGFLRRAEPAVVWLGDEHEFTLAGTDLEHGHIVRGVVLQRERLRGPDRVDALARLIARHVTDTGETLEASAALTAIRDLTGDA